MSDSARPEPATSSVDEPETIDSDGVTVVDRTSTGRGISEDWAATLVGLALVILVLAGVIGKGLVP